MATIVNLTLSFEVSMFEKAIVLIGPKGAGKSTMLRMIGKQLKWPVFSLDQEALHYYRRSPLLAEQDFDSSDVTADVVATRLLSRFREGKLEGFEDEVHLKEFFELYALEHFLKDHTTGVLELGAGHVIFDRKDHLERARALLQPFPHVFALVPNSDPEISQQILAERLKNQGRPESSDNLSYYVTRPTYTLLARQTIYTHNQRPVDTCNEILRIVGQT